MSRRCSAAEAVLRRPSQPDRLPRPRRGGPPPEKGAPLGAGASGGGGVAGGPHTGWRAPAPRGGGPPPKGDPPPPLNRVGRRRIDEAARGTRASPYRTPP